MTLKQYLETNDMTQAAFAEKVSRPQATINRYIRGTRFPDRETILLIQDATGGQVTPADWYAPAEAAE